MLPAWRYRKYEQTVTVVSSPFQEQAAVRPPRNQTDVAEDDTITCPSCLTTLTVETVAVHVEVC